MVGKLESLLLLAYAPVNKGDITGKKLIFIYLILYFYIALFHSSSYFWTPKPTAQS